MAEGFAVNGGAAVHRQPVYANLRVLDEKEKKKPFFIGVAGGTCCGKVSMFLENDERNSFLLDLY